MFSGECCFYYWLIVSWIAVIVMGYWTYLAYQHPYLIGITPIAYQTSKTGLLYSALLFLVIGVVLCIAKPFREKEFIDYHPLISDEFRRSDEDIAQSLIEVADVDGQD